MLISCDPFWSPTAESLSNWKSLVYISVVKQNSTLVTSSILSVSRHSSHLESKLHSKHQRRTAQTLQFKWTFINLLLTQTEGLNGKTISLILFPTPVVLFLYAVHLQICVLNKHSCVLMVLFYTATGFKQTKKTIKASIKRSGQKQSKAQIKGKSSSKVT